MNIIQEAHQIFTSYKRTDYAEETLSDKIIVDSIV